MRRLPIRWVGHRHCSCFVILVHIRASEYDPVRVRFQSVQYWGRVSLNLEYLPLCLLFCWQIYELLVSFGLDHLRQPWVILIHRAWSTNLLGILDVIGYRNRLTLLQGVLFVMCPSNGLIIIPVIVQGARVVKLERLVESLVHVLIWRPQRILSVVGPMILVLYYRWVYRNHLLIFLNRCFLEIPIHFKWQTILIYNT